MSRQGLPWPRPQGGTHQGRLTYPRGICFAPIRSFFATGQAFHRAGGAGGVNNQPCGGISAIVNEVDYSVDGWYLVFIEYKKRSAHISR